MMTFVERKKRREQISKAVQAGDSVQTVRTNFNVSRGTVRDACAEFGVIIPRQAPSTVKLQPMSVSTMQILADLQDIRKTMDNIAAKRGITKQAVSYVYQRATNAGIILPERKVGRPKSFLQTP